jgi:5-methylcytosine-specific restriction enzyme A
MTINSQLRMVRREHVLQALEEVKRAGFPPSHNSKFYYLVYDGEKYPQKYIASLATLHASGTQLPPHKFGATESREMFRALRFDIEDSRMGQKPEDKKISGELISDLYFYSKEVCERRINVAEALRSLQINHSTAKDHFRNFRQMRQGKRYERTMNFEVTDYFLDHFNKDDGLEGLNIALESLKKHLSYYDKLGNGTQRQIHGLQRKYSLIAKGNRHEIAGTYSGLSPSFRDNATQTPIDLTVANTKPHSELSSRDRAFILDILNKYGMEPFERKNMDAGNIRRALERDFFEYVSGDAKSPECKFQFTTKAKLDFEHPESFVQNEIGSQTSHVEGAASEVLRTVFRRNPNARTDCLKHHGYRCKACGFSFENAYGPIGRNFIHVHHVIEISSIGDIYEIDPINDLVPVCPNCHAMLHQKKPALTIEKLTELIKAKQASDKEFHTT